MKSADVECLVDPESGQRISVLRPDWPAPATVNAITTLRCCGDSSPPYDSLNLADHVGDDPAAVRRNRHSLMRALDLPAAPLWLEQVHGTDVIEVRAADHHADAVSPPVADAAFSGQPGCVCTVLTADCLPLLICDRHGRRVAAVHAGWRGLAAGIIEATVAAIGVPAADLLVWLGPAIGATAFEVGAEVREVFIREDERAGSAFRASDRHQHDGERYLADIYALARLRLQYLGVRAVHGGHWCTVTEAESFYSYRRDGRCGRMASLIWLA